jgi:hypothetical protein
VQDHPPVAHPPDLTVHKGASNSLAHLGHHLFEHLAHNSK